MADDSGSTRPRADFSEMGGTGLYRWGNNVYEEFLPNLQFPWACKIYKEMSDNDATIGAVLYMMEQLIKRAGWSVQAVSDKPADKEAALFLQQCMDDMDQSWDNTISEVLSMFVYGFSFHEIVYKVRKGPNEKSSRYKSKHTDGRIGWARLPIRSQHTLYGWEFEDNGDTKAFIQQAPPTYKMVTIPMEKGLLFRTKVSRDNPEGRSLLRNAYRAWYFKKRIEEIEGIGIERDLAGLPTLKPPDGVDLWDPTNSDSVRLKAMADTLVRNVRRDRSEGVVLPFGWDFALLSTGGTRQFDTNAIINRYDNRISITMLADIIMMGGDKVGSFALGDVKKSILSAALEAQIQNVADILNQFAVPKLFQFNHFTGITDLPKIKPGQVETPDIKDLAFLMRSAGLRVDKDLALMNLLRRVISLDAITQEALESMFEGVIMPGDPPPKDPQAEHDDLSGKKALSEHKDPVGHAMDDGSQNKV